MSKREPSHIGSTRFQWKIDTFEKALVVIEVLKLMQPKRGFGESSNIKAGLVLLFNSYPEIWEKGCTHEYLANLFGPERESITRALSLIKIKNGVAF